MTFGLVRPACSAAARRRPGWARRFSSALPSQDVKPEAYISQSTDPLFNLSLEDFLFRSRPSHVPVCLVYRNAPCVVIGRNQNPWRELDVRQMNLVNLPLVRRRSGGGAVYHDLGNTNHSFHIARQDFTRRFHAELVARALNSPPVSLVSRRGGGEAGAAADNDDAGDGRRGAYVNARNDVCIALRQPGGIAGAPTTTTTTTTEERKVSGSAYKIISQRAYHHGTMLLDSDLGRLQGSLRPTRGDAMRSKGVESVSSPVVNLCEAFESRRAHLTHESYVESLVGEFARTYAAAAGVEAEEEQAQAQALHVVQVYEEDEIGRQKKLRQGWEELKSWEWMWGQTPEFHHSIELQQQGESGLFSSDNTLHLHVKNGRIIAADLEDEERGPLGAIARRMVGKRYNVLADAPRTTFEQEGKERLKQKRIEDGLEELGLDGQTPDSAEAEYAKKFLAWLKGML